MKLLFAVIQNGDNKALTHALIEHDISVTRIATTGGYLRGGNTTLMIGVAEERLETALAIIKDKSSRRHTVTVPTTGLPHNADSVTLPMQIVVGGATVFILNVENFVKF